MQSQVANGLTGLKTQDISASYATYPLGHISVCGMCPTGTETPASHPYVECSSIYTAKFMSKYTVYEYFPRRLSTQLLQFVNSEELLAELKLAHPMG